MLNSLKQALRNRITKQLLRFVREQLNGDALTLVDIGAAYGIEPRWKPFSQLIHYIGFEPDARAFADLRAKTSEFRSYRLIPKALWSSEGPLSIYGCRAKGRSSHYSPNLPLMRRFQDPDRVEVEGVTSVPAVTLDSQIDARDFIKIDTQGAELDILKGATRVLQGCIGLEVEVEFVRRRRMAAAKRRISAFVQSVLDVI